MSAIFLIGGIALAIMLVVGGVKAPRADLRFGAFGLALVALAIGFTLASFRYVPEDAAGMVTKRFGVAALPPGKIIATNGEMGPQAEVLPPGWHLWYWPGVYDIEEEGLVQIPAGKVGIINARDGRPLPPDTTYAPEWAEEVEGRMTDAEYFLTTGDGYKGPQTTVLRPASYRVNTKLFEVVQADITTIAKATVGVVKSNVGDRPAPPTDDEGNRQTGRLARLVSKGQRGIWREPLKPGQYYLNTDAFEVTEISTRKQVVRYTDATVAGSGIHEESEIIVRTSDGFTFPVDVRVEYEIEPDSAPLLVATVGDDKDGLRSVMNSAVRAIFRNNAEGVKALDYVQQRSQQESQSLKMLQDEMTKIGATVTAVRIGDVGDEKTLGPLLETQTKREIAIQEQETIQEQQRAAEQQKELTRTEQEAEEEKRLATAKYGVQISEQEKERKIIEAGADAEAVRIKAEAQANAYQLIAEQIGKGNAALVEVLKVVGENNITVTPRVMVVGGEGGAQSAETTALIGTMLDSMVGKQAE
ncbi:SPFH domain / Band 7 family protein [Posidoniimonas corsicana]|uniref:SPFH domain / Band 7 family protein n=1 Tax=Posidoniimonas corsicana TaxID=1938618 RepID=A0A5C5VHP8_9BACT|nr:SPFH domain-containing protein [Posidoniimonas corsicana]TWT38106.1 SPFH domain / Band 7 family protein [Posidoniimonas corsicana]